MKMIKFSKYSASLTPTVCENPPISFVSKVKKIDKAGGPNVDKTEFLMDPDNPA
jgi:hypothetical protein